MDSTATEMRIRMKEFERRMEPMRTRMQAALAIQLKLVTKMLTRRKSKGWRRHVRLMKAVQRR